MQTAATTSHAALTASPRLSATIANETAPSTATAVHNSFVCHAIELLKVGAIDFLRHFKQSLNWLAFGNITTSRLGWKLGATLMSVKATPQGARRETMATAASKPGSAGWRPRAS